MHLCVCQPVILVTIYGLLNKESIVHNWAIVIVYAQIKARGGL